MGPDVVAIAPTGAGKTPVFLLPLLITPKPAIFIVFPLVLLVKQHAASLIEHGLEAVILRYETITDDNLKSIS
ncbi:hypothetical protein CPB86DRAFT_820148 [Serendipita vermifera]|nr:hypothetical protein CPB86DRAFT_820148 [Serendipita vermifera]